MLQSSQKWINNQVIDWKVKQLKDWRIDQQMQTKTRPTDDYGNYHTHLFME